MKMTTLRTLCGLILILPGFMFFQSCKKKSTNVVVVPDGVLFCKVNGNSWQSDAASKFYIDDQKDTVYGTYVELRGDTALLINAVKVAGTDSSGLRFYVRLNSGKTGTYSGTGTAKYSCVYLEGIQPDHIFLAVLGYNTTYSLTISAYDATTRTVSGTFNLSMTPKSTGTNWSITEGKFTNVKFLKK